MSDLKVGDRVKHNETELVMVVTGLGDIDGRDLVWCEWRNHGGQTKGTTFPATELSRAA